MGKYAGLGRHLSVVHDNEWHASFSEIERLIGSRLPASARQYPAWWGNHHNNNQAAAWLDAGWQVENLNLMAERVTFCRVSRPKSGWEKHKKAVRSTHIAPLSWDTPDPVSIRIDITWSPTGCISLGADGRLIFPKVPSEPGLYRFRIRKDNRESVYIGETDNLSRRFFNYRNPGQRQQTNLRLNEVLRVALKDGAEIAVALIFDEAKIERDGLSEKIHLGSKAARRLFEQAAIHVSAATEAESLNR